jgi:hypothetical protein
MDQVYIKYTIIFQCKTLQNLPKLWIFHLKTNHLATLNVVRQIILMRLVLIKTAIFSSKDWQKSSKIVTITLTPVFLLLCRNSESCRSSIRGPNLRPWGSSRRGTATSTRCQFHESPFRPKHFSDKFFIPDLLWKKILQKLQTKMYRRVTDNIRRFNCTKKSWKALLVV